MTATIRDIADVSKRYDDVDALEHSEPFPCDLSVLDSDRMANRQYMMGHRYSSTT
ncbi:hypothetical protein ACL02S_00840 [Nocardia sp. 004]|uniref:hypothetical protein n=1 Tax=Nocardia sp. 004 TaxID=3385978 RepID=UPI0039A1BF79